MIAIEETRRVEPGPVAAPDQARRWHRTEAAPWNAPARIAWRELWRRPVRSALLVLLVAMPAMVLTIIDVGYRTANQSEADQFRQLYGLAEVAAEIPVADAAAIAAMVPDPPVSSTFHEVTTAFLGEDGTAMSVTLTDIDLGANLTGPILAVDGAEAPASPTELAVSRSVAERFGVGLGDELVLSQPDASFTVVGLLGESPRFGPAVAAVVPGAVPTLGTEVGDRVHLIESSAEAEAVVAAHFAARNGTPAGGDREMAESEGGPRGLSMQFAPADESESFAKEGPIWLAVSILVLAASGVVITAAFAVGGRRRITTVGLLSTAGASPRMVRQVFRWEGVWVGLAGAILGIALGLAVLWPSLGLMEDFLGRPLSGWAVSGWDAPRIIMWVVLASAVAAHLPARSLSDTPTLMAIAGRRRTAPVPGWAAPAGLAAFGLGCVVVVIGARSSGDGGVAVGLSTLVAGLSLIAAVCLVAPLLVQAVGRVSSRWSGTLKLAGRSLGRSRARHAAVIAAVAMAGSASVVAGVGVNADDDLSGESVGRGAAPWPAALVDADLESLGPTSSSVAVIAFPRTSVDPGTDRPADVIDQALTAAVADIIGPEAVEVPLRVSRGCPTPECAMATSPVQALLEVDAEVAVALELDDGLIARLEENGILHGGYPGASGGVIDVLTDDGTRSVRVGSVVADDSDGELAQWYRLTTLRVDGLVTLQRAEELGLVMREVGTLFVSPAPITGDQVEALDDARPLMFVESLTPSAAPGVDHDPAVVVDKAFEPRTPPSRLLLDGVPVLASFVLVLAVIALALGLSARETAEEDWTLAAVGASPATLARIQVARAWWLTQAGVVLAVPLGLVPALVFLWGAESFEDGLMEIIPWQTLLILVIAVPVATAVVTWAATSMRRRLGPSRSGRGPLPHRA